MRSSSTATSFPRAQVSPPRLDLHLVGDAGAPERGDADLHVDEVSEEQRPQEVGFDVRAGVPPVDLVQEPEAFDQRRLGGLHQPERGGVVVGAGRVGVAPFDPPLDVQRR